MFNHTKTMDIQQFLLKWSNIPLANLLKLLGPGYRYGYIGTEDRTMWPLIMPGAIVQIDERHKKIMSGPWRAEIERPIYFLETRSGYACGWCAVRGTSVILQPHPVSPEAAKIFRLGKDVEVVGQVVAIAMRLNLFPPKILLIDDSRFVRVAAERALSAAGYILTTASDGEEGLRLARETRPDLVMLDMILPKVSGREVLRQLKNDASVKDIPVIILTAKSDADQPELFAEGAAAYFEKSPHILDDEAAGLLAIVERVLGRDRALGQTRSGQGATDSF
jgi:CheY-like chemotaxis protein